LTATMRKNVGAGLDDFSAVVTNERYGKRGRHFPFHGPQEEPWKIIRSTATIAVIPRRALGTPGRADLILALWPGSVGYKRAGLSGPRADHPAFVRVSAGRGRKAYFGPTAGASSPKANCRPQTSPRDSVRSEGLAARHNTRPTTDAFSAPSRFGRVAGLLVDARQGVLVAKAAAGSTPCRSARRFIQRGPCSPTPARSGRATHGVSNYKPNRYFGVDGSAPPRGWWLKAPKQAKWTGGAVWENLHLLVSTMTAGDRPSPGRRRISTGAIYCAGWRFGVVLIFLVTAGPFRFRSVTSVGYAAMTIAGW